MNERVPPPPDEGGRILDESLNEALSRRYLAYALSTITQRALPDVRDGLKPVHRRLLLRHAAPAARSPDLGQEVRARGGGRDSASTIRTATSPSTMRLVRLARIFAQRYPLIDGPGQLRQYRRR